MSRAAVLINIQAVRLGIDHVCLCSQRVKDALCNLPCAAVGAVQSDPDSLIRAGGKRNQISDVAVSAGHIVYRTADLFPLRHGNLSVYTVQIGLDLQDRLLIHLFSVPVHQLNAVIVIRVMAGGNHNAAVKIVGTGNVGDAGRRGHMHQIYVRTRCCQPCNKGVLKHIRRTPGVFADDYPAFSFHALSVIPADKAADFYGMIVCKCAVGLAAEAVSSEIFSHDNNPSFFFCSCPYLNNM